MAEKVTAVVEAVVTAAVTAAVTVAATTAAIPLHPRRRRRVAQSAVCPDPLLDTD